MLFSTLGRPKFDCHCCSDFVTSGPSCWATSYAAFPDQDLVGELAYPDQDWVGDSLPRHDDDLYVSARYKAINCH